MPEPIPTEGQDSNRLSEVDEIRILKRRGYFGHVIPVMSVIRGADATSSANFSTPFFRADRFYEVVEVSERHETAATDGAVNLRKVPSGTAPASGTAVLDSTISLAATANTDQAGTLASDLNSRRLSPGDSLSLEATGLLTSCAGVTVSVMLKSI